MPNYVNKGLNKSKLIRIVVLFFVYLLSYLPSYALVVTADVDGDWSDGATWDSGAAPSCGDTIVVPAGITVDVNSTQNLDACGQPTFILVEGTLDFANGKKIYLGAGSGVIITETGTLTDGGGGGKANVISIGGIDVWVSSEGDIINPTVLGLEFGIEIKSITDGDFNVPSTWDCDCIPDSTNVATIVAGHAVTVSSDARVFELIINGSLSIDNGQELYIKNLWENNGSFTPNESTVSFGGSGISSLQGLRNQEFYNIKLKHGCDLVNNSGLLNLRGILSFENGTFDTSDSLYLISDQNGTGAIGSLTNGGLTGNVFSNRYIMSGVTGWRFLTSCIQGATLADIDDDIITAGVPGSDYPNFSFVSIWDYDETVPGHKDTGFVIPSGMSEVIAAGKGYWVYAGDNLAGTAAFNIDFEGVINQGTINLPVTYTSSGDTTYDGWNLVANPYPCAIDWDSTAWVKANISDEIHIFDPNAGTYAVYAGGVGANGGSSTIASNQAFWVKAMSTGSPVLTASEDCKVTDNSDPYKSQAQSSLLKIYCKKSLSSEFSDEIVLSHEPLSKHVQSLANKFISTHDSVLNVMFNLDGSISSILRLGNIYKTIPIRLDGNSGNTVISFKDNGFIENYWSVYLHDYSTDITYPITGDQTINLGKVVTSVNTDLALLIIPKAQVSKLNPTCELSANGSINANILGMNDHIRLIESKSNAIVQDINGVWKDLSVGTYALTVNHPIDSNLYFDTVFHLEAINLNPLLFENDVLNLPIDLELREPFVSSEWMINGELVAQDSNHLSYSFYSAFLTPRDANLIQCKTINSAGCENLYNWTLNVNEDKLVYPNPYSIENPLNIFVRKGNNTIQIFNLKGQLIESTEVYSDSEKFVELNNMHLAQGQYLLAIMSQSEINYTKLIVNE